MSDPRTALLVEEIREGILNLSVTDSKKILHDELEKISKASTSSSSASEPLLLFRKYAEIANEIKDSKSHDNFNFVNKHLPTFVKETNGSQLFGWEALKQHVFWLRLSCSVFSFLSFVLMVR